MSTAVEAQLDLSSHDALLDLESADFPWCELDSLEVRMAECEALEAGDLDREALSHALAVVLEWIVEPERQELSSELRSTRIARRALALAWLVNPNFFDGSSLAALARSFGANKQRLSKFCAEARRRFGIRNSSVAHGWNFIGGRDK